jgi:Bacterial Ig domain/Cellulase (glycosyl hydrolase family 5)
MRRFQSIRSLLQRLALASATLGAAAAIVLSAPASAGAAQAGLNVSGFFGTPAANAKLEAYVNAAHPAWVRVFVNWDQIEPARGSYSAAQIAAYKAFFASLTPGTKVDVDIVLTPSWASGSTNTAVPPSNPQDFASAVNYLANAFGPAVNAWEIWNEEDSQAWWAGSPAQYAALLKGAYSAIKAANPSATVLLGGLGANNYPYLSSLYAAGAAGSFDAVADHTDDACSLASPNSFAFIPGTQTINQWSFLGFTSVHAVMAANGDGAMPIYMTELGWSTTDSECHTGASAGHKLGGVKPQTQATYLEQAYHCLAQPQYSYVAAGFWYSLVDAGTGATFYDHYGLLTAGLTQKPSFAAFVSEATHGDQLTGGCGNFSGPALRLINPRQGETFSGPLQITVTATDRRAAVAQIALKHDGKTIMNFNRKDAHYSGHTLTGTLGWIGAPHLTLGDHTITVVATDSHGVKTSVTVTVDHVKPPKHHHHK